MSVRKGMLFEFEELSYKIVLGKNGKFYVVADFKVIGFCNYLSSALQLLLLHHRDNKFSPRYLHIKSLIGMMDRTVSVSTKEFYSTELSLGM